MKRVLILGATGSIGRNTLDIIRNHPDEFRLAGLQAHSNEKQLLEDAGDYPRIELCLSGAQPSSDRIEYTGPEGILRLIENTRPDIVVNGIVGASGLPASVKTLENGIDLALANKESMVLAGPLMKHLASVHSCRLLPVDSEHSALFMLLEHRKKESVHEIILTASGGPFRNKPLSEFDSITVRDALAHPTWSMGPKITVDSATMANKGLEVIEAQQLFDFDVERIKVLIHPQSYVHSLIRTKDMALYAQISEPDMRLPIQDALFYPVMREVPWTYLDLAGKTLEFEQPDLERYPMLRLAFLCAETSGSASIAYNGSNEIAVDAFLKETIPFKAMARITEEVLQKDWSRDCASVQEIMEQDRLSREYARGILRKIAQ